jgi:hypothetical protein
MAGIFDMLGFPMLRSFSRNHRPDDTTTADGGKGSRLDAMIDGDIPDWKSHNWEEKPKVYFSHGSAKKE